MLLLEAKTIARTVGKDGSAYTPIHTALTVLLEKVEFYERMHSETAKREVAVQSLIKSLEG